MTKRRGISWAVASMTLGLFVFGIVWTVLYYGALKPMSVSMPPQYPNAFDSVRLTIVNTVIAWWPFILSIVWVLWLWVRSTRQGGGY